MAFTPDPALLLFPPTSKPWFRGCEGWLPFWRSTKHLRLLWRKDPVVCGSNCSLHDEKWLWCGKVAWSHDEGPGIGTGGSPNLWPHQAPCPSKEELRTPCSCDGRKLYASCLVRHGCTLVQPGSAGTSRVVLEEFGVEPTGKRRDIDDAGRRWGYFDGHDGELQQWSGAKGRLRGGG